MLRLLFKMATESQSLRLFSEAELSKVRTSLYFTKPQTQKKHHLQITRGSLTREKTQPRHIRVELALATSPQRHREGKHSQAKNFLLPLFTACIRRGMSYIMRASLVKQGAHGKWETKKSTGGRWRESVTLTEIKQ